MRVTACLLTLSLLGACGGGGLAPLPTDEVRARFPAGGVVDVIEIDAVDRLPLRSAELLAPDGRATPASSLNANPAPRIAFYQEFSIGPYAGNNFGVPNIASGFPANLGGTPQSLAKLLAIISTASIPLPDPVEYRRDWRSYRIQLRFGDPPGEIDTRDIPAPEPPPAS